MHPYIFKNRDCKNNVGQKVPCAHGVSPNSTVYSFASVPKKSPKSNINGYAVDEKCGESLPADYYTANKIVDLHNQYRAQVRFTLKVSYFRNIFSILPKTNLKIHIFSLA